MDPQQITASVLTALIKDAFKGAAKGASELVSSSWSKVFEEFSPYMRETYKRTRNVRIISNKDKDIDIYKLYVESNYNSGEIKATDEQLIHEVRDENNIIVNGIGGAGKTFFMRHLWLTLFAAPEGKTPLFIELRRINDEKNVDLIQFIASIICPKSNSLSKELLESLCKSGRFYLLLDGFDEVLTEFQEPLQKQILSFTDEFPGCTVVVSSRHDQRFSGWRNFVTYSSVPFTIVQTKKLLKNVPFDRKTRDLFLKDITPEFFQKHQSFLSTPLLAIMMLMTYRENYDIPSEMHLFYEQAFLTLFKWHDATKAFKRERSLDVDQFQKSFSIFCLLSYYKQMYEFTHSQVVETIQLSSKINSINTSSEKILEDYTSAVNIMKQEGFKYIFIHRSFQEYFSALALCRYMPDKFPEFIKKISKRTTDDVLKMCFSMRPELVAQSYVLPAREAAMKKGVFGQKGSSFYAEIYNTLGVELEVYCDKNEGDSYSFSVTVDLDPDLHLLGENYTKLSTKKDRPRNRMHYLESPIVDYFFEIFENDSSFLGKECVFSINFSGGRPHAYVGSKKTGRPEATPEQLNLANNLLLNHQREFENSCLDLAARLQEIEDWSEEVVISFRDRDLSIEQIFDL